MLHHNMTGKESLPYKSKGLLLGLVSQTKNRLGGERITAYKCTEVVKPRRRKLFSLKDCVTHPQKPRNKFTLEIKSGLLFTSAVCSGQNPLFFKDGAW